MLRIECPNCGARDETELIWGGEARIVRPSDPSATSDAAWSLYLYFRENPKALSEEWWYCQVGCRTWFRICRDTATDHMHPVASQSGVSEP